MKFCLLFISVVSNFAAASDHYSILWAGDTHFGVNYRKEEEVLPSYQSSIEKMREFFAQADFAVGNLETAITDETKQYFESKRYPHREIPALVGAFLKNFDIVSLANNHALDYGPDALVSTHTFLNQWSIRFIGAGPNNSLAAKPDKIDIPIGDQTIKLAIFACFDYRKNYDAKYGYYAGKTSPGVLAITSQALKNSMLKIKEEEPERKIIVFTHWGIDYQDLTKRQQKQAETMVEWGADLIIGHGPHIVQEISLVESRPVIYSLGNFVFNTPGRYKKYKKPGYSLVAFMDFSLVAETLKTKMRFYPIVSDNKLSDFQPRPVAEEEVEDVQNMLLSLAMPAHEMVKDDLGYFFVIDLPW